MTQEVSEMSRKLGDISRVMADGFYFIHMRGQCEQFQAMADAGDPQAIEMIERINTFHRLCVHVERASHS